MAYAEVVHERKRIITQGIGPNGKTWRRAAPDRVIFPSSRDQQRINVSSELALLTSLIEEDEPYSLDWETQTQEAITGIQEKYNSLGRRDKVLFASSILGELVETMTESAKAADLYLRVGDVLHPVASENGRHQLPVARGFIRIVPVSILDGVGDVIREGSHTREDVLTRIQQEYPECSPRVVEQVIESYAAIKSIGETGKGKLTVQRGKEVSSHELQRAFAAAEVIAPIRMEHESDASLDSLIDDQRAAFERDRIDTIEVAVEGGKLKVMPLSDLLIGYEHSNPGFLQQVLTYIEKHPEYKPDVIVFSGVLFGEHKYRDTKLKGVTVPGYSMDRQFRFAREVLTQLAEKTGAVIVYTLSDNDHEVARDIAIDATRALKQHSKVLVNKERDTYLDPMQLYQITKDDQFTEQLRFATYVAFEYCLRSGRALRTADEISHVTAGDTKLQGRDEYAILLDAYRLLSEGKSMPQNFARVLSLDAIPLPGRPRTDFFVVDNVELVGRMRDGKRKRDTLQRFFHSLQFGRLPQYGDPLKAIREYIKQLTTRGIHIDGAWDMSQGWPVQAMNTDGVWYGGTPNLLQSGQVMGDMRYGQYGMQHQLQRTLATRGITGDPAVWINADSISGEREITFFTQRILEHIQRAGAELKEQEETTIYTIVDWQIGSSTARPDLQMKYLYMLKRDLLAGKKVAINCIGDHIHGNIYPSYYSESGPNGLTNISDQKNVMAAMLSAVLKDVPPELRQNIQLVTVAAGNHEWQNGKRDQSDLHIGFLLDWWRNYLEPAFPVGDMQARQRVVDLTNLSSKRDGSFIAKANAGVVREGSGTLFLQHQPNMAKSQKGPGTAEPVVGWTQTILGQGSIMENVDAVVAGHMHSPGVAIIQDIIALMPGSLAGESAFELGLGFSATIAPLTISIGGGKPFRASFLPQDALVNFEIPDGEYFSDSNLARRPLEFHTDRGFNPLEHGFYQDGKRGTARYSALQKAIHRMIEDIIFSSGSAAGNVDGGVGRRRRTIDPAV